MQFAVWYTHDFWGQNGDFSFSTISQVAVSGVHGISCVHSVPSMPCHAGNVRLQIVAWPCVTACTAFVARPGGGTRREQNALFFTARRRR